MSGSDGDGGVGGEGGGPSGATREGDGGNEDDDASETEGGGNGGQGSLGFSRWWLVAVGALVIGTAGTYQFVWSSIRGPLGSQVGASEATLGTLFTVLVIGQTLAQFPAGWFRDRYGPRVPMAAGTVMLAGGYLGLSTAGSPLSAGIAVAVGGCGAGAAYTVAINTPVKWFDERRGLATGIVTMTYGGFSVAFIPAIRGGAVGSFGDQLLVLAGVAAAVGVAGIVAFRDPEAAGGPEEGPAADTPDAGDGSAPGSGGDRDAAPEPNGGERADPDGGGRGGSPGPDGGEGGEPVPAGEYGWRDAVRTWQFWVLYGVFVVVNGVGLMLIGTSVTFAEQLGLPAAAATATASVIALADSGGVFVGGAVADRFGEAPTVGTALVLSGIGIVAAVTIGEAGLATAFVAVVGAAAFFRAPVFSVFPSLVGKYYGTARSSENYAALYTAKIPGGVLGGTVTGMLVATLGWSTSFLLGAGLLAVAGLAMLTVKPVEGPPA